MKSRPKVFISYSHENEEHREKVLQLAWALQRDGIEVALDRFLMRPKEGWPTWCERQLRPEVNDWVLMVSTQTYWDRVDNEVPADEGCGVFWEGRIIKNYVYRGKDRDSRFVTVTFDKAGIKHLPPYMDRDSSYLLGSWSIEKDSGSESLYRLITRQPAVESLPLGKIKDLPTRRAGGSGIEKLEEVGQGKVKWEKPDEVAGPEPGSSQKVTKESSMDNNHDMVNAGTIMVADVADFSDIFDDATRGKVYKAVWGYVQKHALLKEGNAKKVFCDNTLDGAVVCFRPPLYKEAVEFACNWVKHVSEELEKSQVKVQLRVGIGRGNFLLEPRTGESKEQQKAGDADADHQGFDTDLIPYGRWVNEVDRLARIAGVDKDDKKGFVVLDEAFVRDFESHDYTSFRRLIAPAIFPDLVQEPCAKLTKAGHMQKFRVLNAYDKSPLVPTGVAEIAQLSKMIQTVMGKMAARLWEYLYPDYLEHVAETDSLPSLSQGDLRAQSKLRVSLFCQDPREVKGKLVCTNFRLLDWAHTPEESVLSQPFTGYPLSEEGERGPAGTAFTENRCLFVNDLPAVKLRDGKPTATSLNGYLDALEESTCGVSREVAKSMKRYARTYMCLPIGLVPERPTSVVCLDLAGETSWMSQEDGLAVASLLQEEFSGLLSLLVDKRT